MNQREFEELLDIYGADIARWPAEVQGQAKIFHGNSAAARTAARRMAEMDRLLMDCRPKIETERAEAAASAVIGRCRPLPRTPPAESRPDEQPARLSLSEWADWLAWRWVPRGAMVVCLLVLGGAANLLMRAETVEAPLDLWLSANFLLPLGG